MTLVVVCVGKVYIWVGKVHKYSQPSTTCEQDKCIQVTKEKCVWLLLVLSWPSASSMGLATTSAWNYCLRPLGWPSVFTSERLLLAALFQSHLLSRFGFNIKKATFVSESWTSPPFMLRPFKDLNANCAHTKEVLDVYTSFNIMSHTTCPADFDFFRFDCHKSCLLLILADLVTILV